MASACTAQDTHLDVSRRRTSSIAIGRSPPLLFLQAKRVAPHRYCKMQDSARPAQRRLTTLNSPWRAKFARSGEELNTASFMWFALRHEGPEAVTEGKDRRALMSAQTTWTGGGTGSTGIDGGPD